MRRLTVSLNFEWGNDQPVEVSETGALVEHAHDPERPQMGFLPPSDPSRRVEESE